MGKNKDGLGIEKGNSKARFKNDLILMALILLLALASFLFIRLFLKKNSHTALVKIDSQIVKTIDLNQDQELVFEGYQGGYNKLVVKDSQIYVEDADCRDKLCKNQGKISKTHETIVCLPHRLVIEIVEDQTQEQEIDDYAR